jgi:hypothetical protein
MALLVGRLRPPLICPLCSHRDTATTHSLIKRLTNSFQRGRTRRSGAQLPRGVANEVSFRAEFTSFSAVHRLAVRHRVKSSTARHAAAPAVAQLALHWKTGLRIRPFLGDAVKRRPTRTLAW